MGQSTNQPASQDANRLGQELRRVREVLKLTLRAVEEKSGISNAYLSQLETGGIKQPSPMILHKLAQAYGVPYELLMETAGYMSRNKPGQPKRTLTGAALSRIGDLTPEEEEELVKYLAFLRSKWSK